MLLNVGCGDKAVGDVNVDLFPDDRSQCEIDWDPKKVKNFVLADVCFFFSTKRFIRFIASSNRSNDVA